MGQKINPISLRLQNTNKYFNFCWYSNNYYTELLNQDFKIQKFLNSILEQLQYPTGKFFIQNSQKKIKIFSFFCSPLKSRKIKSNFFKTKYYKITRNPLKLRSSKFSKFLKLKNDKKYELILFNQKKINFDKIKQESILNLKYLLLNQYFEEFHGNNIRNLNSTKSRLINTKVKKSINLINFFFQKKKSNGRSKTLLTNAPYTEKNLSLFSSLFPIEKKESTLDLKKNNLIFYKNIDKMTYRKHIENILTQNLSMNVNIHTFKTYDHFRSASFLAEEIVYYLEKRIPFRRIKNRILKEVKYLPAVKGVRIACSGRVGGRSKKAQRAKTETIQFGQTSLHVFSSRIDFSSKSALTAFGLIGVKVWICYKD